MVSVKFFFSLVDKKMSGCEDFDVSQKFMFEIVPFISLFSQRRFVFVDYSVCDEEFVVKVDYDKDQFEYLIQEYVCKILEELRNSKIHKYNWAAHRPFCEDIEVPDNYFLDRVLITVPRE